MHFPNVPTLVLSGDLDSVTSVTDAQQVTDQFPNAHHVIIPNLPHVVAGGDLVGMRLLDRIAISCGSWRRATPAVPRTCGPRGPCRGLHAGRMSSTPLDAAGRRSAAAPSSGRLAAAGLETAGDVIAQWYATVGSYLRGLRGGTFDYVETANGYKFRLKELRWTEDVAVSGTVTLEHEDEYRHRAASDLAASRAQRAR